jgi:hypothetical protein
MTSKELTRILLVEDNHRFIAAALDYLGDKALIVVAEDYEKAMFGIIQGHISGNRFDGAIIDCFFPRAKGGDHRTLGYSAIEIMLASDPVGQSVERYEQALANSLDLSNPELRRFARYLGSRGKEPEKDPLFSAVKQVGTLGKELNTFLQKENLRTIFRKDLEDFIDYYEELRQALKKDPANQALGILVAEKCEELKIPFVLATSTYHHDLLTQPIQNYCSRRGWSLIDCSPGREHDKETPEYWNHVYEELLRRME